MSEEMSALDQELCDEWLRCERALAAHERFVAEECPRGYVSRKVIRGRERFYLQWRDGAHVRSRYIPEGEVDKVRGGVAARKDHEASVRRLREDMARIELVVGRDAIESYRTEMGL